MSSEETAKINVPDWLKNNSQHFLPPVCNLFMHFSGQLSVMYVGGPNQRTDYHIQRGEELFYQPKGDMVLKVVVKGSKRDVHIREGEIFLLPQRIPHSPQRYQDTLGLVLERKRRPHELDILRFYTPSTDASDLTILFERNFHWNEVQTKMAEYFEEFNNSEESKTGTPTQQYSPIFEVNSVSDILQPFNLHQWMCHNATLIDQQGPLPLFDTDFFKHKVLAHGSTNTTYVNHNADTWFYQHKGESVLTVADKRLELHKDDSYLLTSGVGCHIEQSPGNYLLSFCQEE